MGLGSRASALRRVSNDDEDRCAETATLRIGLDLFAGDGCCV